MISRWLKWTAISLAVLPVVLLTASFIADEPLRRYVERTVNEAVEGYSFQIGALDLHPLALSVDLRDVVVRQEVYPDPPLADIHEISLDAQHASLLGGKVSANVHLNDPVFSVTRQQIETASAKADGGTEQAIPWQDRVRDMFPFEAALFIKNGEVRYTGQPSAQLIRMTALDIEAHNLTNHLKSVSSHPSELLMRSRLFGTARMEFSGRAELLTKPVPAFDAFVKLSGLRIADLMPIVGTYNVVMKEGTLSATGRIMHEKRTVLSLESFVLEGARIGYVYLEETKSKQRDGYVKPLFQDVDVYEPEKDQDKSMPRKIDKAVIDGVTSLLENVPRDEVATTGDVSGPVENPQASTWQIIEKLVQNAVFNAILQGFEEQT